MHVSVQKPMYCVEVYYEGKSLVETALFFKSLFALQPTGFMLSFITMNNFFYQPSEKGTQQLILISSTVPENQIRKINYQQTYWEKNLFVKIILLNSTRRYYKKINSYQFRCMPLLVSIFMLEYIK